MCGSAEPKIRLLFVVAHLIQSGSERFVYELCKSIDRSRFDVEVLTKWRVRPTDYYYDKIRALGIRVHRRLPILLNRLQRHARPFYLASRPVLERLHRWAAGLFIGNLLEQFDVINAIQIENYYLLQPLLNGDRRVVTSLMSNAFQYRFDPYADCDPERTYKFVIIDRSQYDDFRQACPKAEWFFFPIGLDMRDRADLSSYVSSKELPDIGLFTRLAGDRPIRGLFEAFAALLERRNARLRVWGRGNPAHLVKELKALGIRDRVVFEGHTPDIVTTIREAGLSMVWMPVNGTQLSYAGVELASLGVPMLFWNVSNIDDAEVARRTRCAMQSFQVPASLGVASDELLQNPDACRANGQRIRQYVMQTYDIADHIAGLERYFERIAAERLPRVHSQFP